MTEKIRKYIRRHEMITPGNTICVGLSGGADSVCLLRILLDLYENLSVRIMAVHVNHQLRGREADEDEDFVRDLCSRWQVPLRVCRYPVAEIAGERGIGTEEAGRLVRQEVWRDCLKKYGADRIALAHHANDRAETFLFHAARGSSLAGLAGIRPVQTLWMPSGFGEDHTPEAYASGEKETEKGALIIRPLLDVTREEIEAYLTGLGQSWRTDESNRDQTYTRNAVRHSLIPWMETHVNPQAVRHLAEAAADLDEADRYFRQEAERRRDRYVREEAETLFVGTPIREEPSLLQGYLLLDALEKAGGSRRDLGREQVAQLQELFVMQTGKRIDLPYGLAAVREYEGIRICRREKAAVFSEVDGNDRTRPESERRDGSSGGVIIADGERPDGITSVTGEGTFSWCGWHFTLRILAAPWAGAPEKFADSADRIPRNQYTKWFDCDKIYGTLCVRGRRPSDRLVVDDRGGSKKLKAYLIDRKVPRPERDRIPLLACGHRICWVVGYRMGEDVKVTEETVRILEICAEPPQKKEPAGTD